MYPQYADFEIAHALFFLRKAGKAEIITASIDGKHVKSVGGIVTKPQLKLSEAGEGYDLILLPGGDGISEVLHELVLHNFLKQANAAGVPIASICASATFLGKAGLLHGKSFTCLPHTYEQYKHVFTNASYTNKAIEPVSYIITAKGTAFPEFTIAIGEMLNFWKDEEHKEKAYQFCIGKG